LTDELGAKADEQLIIVTPAPMLKGELSRIRTWAEGVSALARFALASPGRFE
jgi:hypothetical protein